MRQNGLETSAMVVDSVERGAILGGKVEKLGELLVCDCLLGNGKLQSPLCPDLKYW